MPSPGRRSALIVVTLLVLAPAAAAQGLVTGVMRDASGAVLPGSRSAASQPHRKDQNGGDRHRRDATLVDLRPGAYGDIHVDRLQHGQARRGNSPAR